MVALRSFVIPAMDLAAALSLAHQAVAADAERERAPRTAAEDRRARAEAEAHAQDQARHAAEDAEIERHQKHVAAAANASATAATRPHSVNKHGTAGAHRSISPYVPSALPTPPLSSASTGVKSFAAAFGAVNIPTAVSSATAAPTMTQAPMHAAAAHAPRATRRHALAAASSIDQSLPHPFAAIAHAQAATGAAAQAAPAGSSRAAPALAASVPVFHSQHKIADAASLSVLWDEARLALQFGRPASALPILQYLDHQCKQAHLVHHLPLHYLIAVCRREMGQETLALTAIGAQMKSNEAQGLHSAAVRVGASSNSPDESHQSSASELTPHQHSSHVFDPDFIAPSLACEFERGMAYEALSDPDAARRSARSFSRLVDSTSLLPDLVDNTYPAWMALAKWLANIGCDSRARMALQKAAEAHAASKGGNVTTHTGVSLIPDPHWLLLSIYVEWSLGAYDRAESLASFLLHAPASVLTPLSSDAEESERQLQATQSKAALFLAASTMALATEPSSAALPGTAVAAAAAAPSTLDSAARLLDSLLAHPLHHSLEVLHAASILQANLAMLRGSSLRPAIQRLHQAKKLEVQMQEQARERTQVQANLGAQQLQQSPPRFPFFGPLAHSASPRSSSGALPPASRVCMYDLRCANNAWQARATAAASPATARGGCPSPPPNFDLLSASGGINPVHYSARYLSVVIDLYSDLLLRYGIEGQARMLFYRANLYALLGQTDMQLHDLEILQATAPGWFGAYVQSQTSLDFPDLSSTAASRVAVVSTLHVHLAAQCFGSTLFDKNVSASNGNLLALEKKLYTGLARIGGPASGGSNHKGTTMPPSTVGPFTQMRAWINSNNLSLEPEPNSAPIRVTAAPRAATAGSTGNSSRASTSYAASRPAHTFSAGGPQHGSLAGVGGGGGGSSMADWDPIPTAGLLDCEDALYFDAIVADLTRQHAACSFNHNSAVQTAMMNQAQESFEQILKLAAAAAATPPVSSSTLSPPAVSGTSPSSLATTLLCTEGLAMLLHHRLKFVAARHLLMEGLLTVWNAVDQTFDARAARQERKQKEAADSSKVASSSTPKLNAPSLEQQQESSKLFNTQRPPRSGLSGSAIVASAAPFHVKALKLSAPLLASLDDEEDDAVDADLPFDAGTATRPISRDGTTYTASSSYWGSERSAETTASKRKHDEAAAAATATSMAPPAWLEPSRLQKCSLRRHCAMLLSLLGIGYALEANTDTSLLLLYRALALDAHDFLGNLYLFLHHFRFSPLNLAVKHYLTLCVSVPLFIPGLDTVAYSPVRYPLQEDKNFSGIVARGDDEEAEEGHQTRTPERAESAFPMGSPRARPIADASTLAYPFPICSARCLTSRLMDRPYTHTSSPEVSLYLQSISSHIQAVKHRNAVAILNQRQNEVVERIKTGDTGVTRASIKGLDSESAAALLILHAQAGSELSSSVPLVLSLTNLHPTHVLHPLQQRNKFKFDAASSENEPHEEEKNPTSILKPSKPSGAAKATGRSSKVASAGASKKASSASALAAAAEPKIIFDPADPSATRNLPPFLHVEHRTYNPSSGSSQWTSTQWYKESLKLLSFSDKNGLALAFLKCLHLDVDYCASLNYVLSLLETNLSESATEEAEAQAKRDWKEIEALEAAAASGSASAVSSPTKSSPKGDRKPGGSGINKHSPAALAAMFGRDKSLPIVWDLYSRGKQWEELYGLTDLAFADYSYALHFLPLGDILWRRGLLCKSRRYNAQAISDLSEAIRQTMMDRGFLEKIPGAAAASGTAQKKPVLEEVKAHMNEKQRKEVEAANAAKLLAVHHSPQNSLAIVKAKLSQYHLVRGILVFNSIPPAAHAGAHSQYANADNDANESLKLAPKNPVALRLHSLCLTHLGKYSDAARALEKYLELQPRDWGSRMRLASLWSYAGSYDKALAGFNKLLSHAPHNPAVHYAKALVYFRQHMWHEAHDVLQTTISLAPKYWLAYMRQGEVLERLESYELAIETLQMALAGATAAAKAAGNPSPASSGDDALTLDGDGYTDLQSFHLDFIHKTLGRIYLAQAQRSYMAYLAASEEERKSKAKKDLHRSSAMMEQAETTGGAIEDGSSTTPRPPSRASKDLWGEAVSGTAKELKLLKAASTHRAASIRSAHLTSEEVLAAESASGGSKPGGKKTIEYVSKCLHMALQSLQQAVLATPGVADAESHYLLALTILFLAGNRQRDPGGKVWALLQRVVSLQPQHSEARFVRGFLLQREGRLEEAAKELDLCLAIEPEHVLALQARSYLHFLASERQKAQETYAKMINQPGPLRAVAYANRGLVHYLNGSVQNALADLDYAISVAPMHALAWLYRAELHKSLGFMNEAIADYRMAAPLLKAKLEEAELERKQMESPFGRRSTHSHARNSSAFGSFSGELNRPSATQPPAVIVAGNGGGSLFAKDAEFRRSPSPPLPALGGGFGIDSFEPAATPASGSHAAAHHTRSASSGSMTLTLPAGFSSIPLSREGSAAPHARRSAAMLWRAVRELVHSKQFAQTLALTPSPSAAAASSETISGLPILAEFSSAVNSLSFPPPVAAAERDRVPVPLVSQFDVDSLHLPLIQGGEHFRLHGTRESALQFQSEVGLTARDLDSVHNSLGILLHQQAAENKKTALQAVAAGGARMGDEIKRQKAAAAATAAQRRDGAGSGGPLAPLLQSSSVADTSPDDASESLHYFSSNSSHFEAHYNRALIFLETGHPSLALGELKSVVERAPEFANGHNNLGVCLEGIGELKKAAEHYTLALQLTGSKHLIAAFNLANTKNSSQQFQDAIKLYTIFLRRCKGIINAATQSKRGGGATKAGGAKAAELANDTALLSHAHSEDSRESDPTGPRASFLPAKKSAEFLRPFEREMQESLEKAEAEKTPRTLAAAKEASVRFAAAQTQAKTESQLQALSKDESNLAKLIPLALNNRAIAFQNLGLYDRALRGYTRALQINPSLSYIKFNRAHLHMVQGDCFGALEDIRAYAQERAKTEANAGTKSTSPLDRERERPQSREIIGRNQAQTGSTTSGGDKGSSLAGASSASSTSLAYLQSFSDYCQRFQWGLAVACKDLMTGLKVLPIVANLNVNVPVNPLVIFNPHMLGDANGGDWKRLRELIRRASDYPDGVRTEFEVMTMGASITGVPVSSLSSDSKLKAVLAPSSADSSFIAHLKMALKAQVHQQYSECLDALLKAIYLLPPSPQYLEQQRAEFARRHNLSSSVRSTLDSALLTAQFPPDAGASVDLSGELHEVLIFWRARLQVFLGSYDGAVADMEFHTNSMRLGAQPVTHTTTADGSMTARRKKPRGLGLGDGLELSDEDEALDDNEDLTAALGLTTALSSIGMPTSSSTASSSPRTQSRVDSHQRTSSTSSVASKRVSSASSMTLTPTFRTVEDEQSYHMQQAQFAHRAAVRNSRLLCYLGSLYHMRRRDADALRMYSAAIALDPHNFYALLNRTLVHRLQGRFSNAIADLFEVVKILVKMDEKQRAKEVRAKVLRNGEIVPPPATFEPEIDCGLHVVPSLKFTRTQQAVYSVLQLYVDTLKLNPQEHWDSITSIQGRLAMAVDAALAERHEKKKQSMQPAIGKANSKSISTTSADDDDADESKLSTAEGAQLLRQQLDTAAEKLMEHLIDPKMAREKQAVMQQEASAIPAAVSFSSGVAPLPPQSTLALAGVPFSAPAPAVADAGFLLDLSFEQAFANMQSLIHSQLPKKRLAPTTSSAAATADKIASPAAAASSQSARTMTTTTTAPSDTALKLQSDLSGSLSSVPSANFNNLMSGLREREKKEAAEAAALALSQAHAAQLYSSSSGASLPTQPAAARTAAAVSSSRRGRVGASLLPTQPPKPPVPTQLSLARSARAGSVVTHVAEAQSASAGTAGSASSSLSTARPPAVPRPVAPDSSALSDDAFAASLDPSLPAAVRARLLDARRQHRIAEVRNRFAGTHARSASFYGLLGNDSDAAPTQHTDAFDALHSEQQTQLRAMELAALEADEGEAFDDRQFDDE